MIEQGVDERQKDQINQAIHKVLPDFEMTKIILETKQNSKDLFIWGKTNDKDPGKLTDIENNLENLNFVDFAFISVSGDRQ